MEGREPIKLYLHTQVGVAVARAADQSGICSELFKMQILRTHLRLGIRSSGDRTQQLQLQTTGLEKPARGTG